MTSIRILTQRTTLKLPRTLLNPLHTRLSSTTTTLEPPTYLDPAEKSIFTKLQTQFSPTKLEVQDVSGGCGSMYAVEIASEKFKGLPLLKQHRLVKDALGEQVKGWHGFQLRTKVPE